MSLCPASCSPLDCCLLFAPRLHGLLSVSWRGVCRACAYSAPPTRIPPQGRHSPPRSPCGTISDGRGGGERGGTYSMPRSSRHAGTSIFCVNPLFCVNPIFCVTLLFCVTLPSLSVLPLFSVVPLFSVFRLFSLLLCGCGLVTCHTSTAHSHVIHLLPTGLVTCHTSAAHSLIAPHLIHALTMCVWHNLIGPHLIDALSTPHLFTAQEAE